MTQAAEEIFLDATQFENLILVATSNKLKSDFNDRFQSRFEIHDVVAPECKDIENYLIDQFSISQVVASRVADSCGGDVRAAITDALRVQQLLDNPELMAA